MKMRRVLLMKHKIILVLSVLFIVSCGSQNKATVYPVLTLKGDIAMQIPLNEEFVEPGFIAFDSIDGDLTGRVVIDYTNLDVKNEGLYQIYYSVKNRYGDASITAIRSINVVASSASLSLKGESLIVLELGSVSIFPDPGFIAKDIDGTFKNESVKVNTNLNLNSQGLYQITYTFIDSYQVVHTVLRHVRISLPDTPIIILEGAGTSVSNPFILQYGMTQEDIAVLDPGYKAFDKANGDISQAVFVDYSTVDTTVSPASIQELVYSIKSMENEILFSTIRYIRILADAISPEISILKSLQETIEVGSENFTVSLKTDVIATDSGALLPESHLRYTISQISDFSNSATTIRNNVLVEEVTDDAGFFKIIYTATDESGNEGENYRLVQVVDYDPPVLVFDGVEVTQNIQKIENFDYAASIDSILPNPSVSDNAKTFSLYEIGDSLSSIDSRKVGTYYLTVYAIDATGNESYQINRIINVNPPNNPIVINGGFEDSIPAVGTVDEANNLMGWQWVDLRGYMVQGTYNVWGPAVTSTEPVIYSGVYSSLSLATVTDQFSRSGIASAKTIGPELAAEEVKDPVTGLIPIDLAAYIVRTMGKITQKDIYIHKEVDYLAQVFIRVNVGSSNQTITFRLLPQTPGMLLNGKTSIEVVANPEDMTQHYWEEFSIDFDANLDGLITIEIDKSDISSSSYRNGTEFYYDDISISVKENGYAKK